MLLTTVQVTYESGHQVEVRCKHCYRMSWLDLPCLIATGRGDEVLETMPRQCICGNRERSLTVVQGW